MVYVTLKKYLLWHTTNYALSLFVFDHKQQHVHTSEETERELVIMLCRARAEYRKFCGSLNLWGHPEKTYEHFVRDFINGHTFIPCQDFRCLNNHKMNLGILSSMLAHKAFMEEHFFQKDLSAEAILSLVHEFQRGRIFAGEAIPIRPPQPPMGSCRVSFNSRLKEQHYAQLAECANAYQMFLGESTTQSMRAFFECEEGFVLQVSNVREVAVMLDALRECGFICARWQLVCEQRKLLFNARRSAFISANALASALRDAKHEKRQQKELHYLQLRSRLKELAAQSCPQSSD